MVKFSLVIHGGAGTILKKNMTNEKELIYIGAQYIVLKSLNNSSNPGKSFFDEVFVVF